MVIYECKTCRFVSTLKQNYENHLKTSKHEKQLKDSPNIAKRATFSSPNIAESSPKTINISCKYCSQIFNHRSSMYKHIKYTCTKNKDEDIKELVRLMNLQLEQKERELQIHKEQIAQQNKQIEKLMGKLEINGSFNTTINNIQLLAYKNTDVSHLTDTDYSTCIKQVNYCVKKLIEKIHFNPEKPENMNIYISNIKDKFIMVYDGTNWNLSTKEYELDKLYEEKEYLLEEWLEDNRFPELKEKFVRYLNNKEKDDNLNFIKEEIKLLMYNKTKELKLIN